jgi:hypothetical protein
VARQVKGVLFADYVRMMRATKSVAWADHLAPQDMQWLTQRIEPFSWYPMETYERFGLAILDHIARGDFQAVRQWGRYTIDELQGLEPELFSARDPRETFMRFQILRQTLFDFPAAEVVAIRDGKVILDLCYGMSARAEEAAAWQSIGFLERLMELSGAENVDATFERMTWEGAPSTRIVVTWSPPPSMPPAVAS